MGTIFQTARARAIAASGLVILMLVATIAVGVYRARANQSELETLQAASESSAALEHGRGEFLNATNSLAALAFVKDPNYFFTYSASMSQAKIDIGNALDLAETKQGTAEIAELQQLLDKVDRFKQLVDASSQSFLVGDLTGAQKNQDELTALGSEIAAKITQAADGQRSIVEARTSKSRGAATISLWAMVVTGALALVGTVVGASYAGISVIRPLRSLRLSARSITEGDLGVRAVVSGPEEISSLARDFNLMAETLIGRSTALEREIEERSRVELELRGSEEQYRGLFQTVRDVIFTLSLEGTITSLSPAFETLTGWPCERWVGKNFWHLVLEEDLSRAMELFRAMSQGESPPMFELHIRKESGDYLVAEVVATPRVAAGRVIGVLGVARDVTERRHSEETIRHLAYHDTLTGLPNRALFKDRLTVALAQAHRRDQMVAVLFLDLDRFKLVNDTLGHVGGDALLQSVGAQLSTTVRPGDTVARAGGDEFTILLNEVDGLDGVDNLCQRILKAIREPRIVGGRELRVTASVGVAIYPKDGKNPDMLLKNADIAMYRAKEKERDSYRIYTPSMSVKPRLRLAIENDLRRALERKELVVYYQPQVDIQTGRITGAEALARWRHPNRGLIAPAEFIPVAEETGLILQIDSQILRTACADMRTWKDEGVVSGAVAVNLSARWFQRSDLVETISKVLAEERLGSDALIVEITEGIVMEEVDRTVEVLRGLSGIGVRTAIDDFGTGYSSLAYLKRLPVDVLKIDRSFVHGLPGDAHDAAAVSIVIALAKGLNLEVIAEGVETESQLSFLTESSCDQYQGYLFSRPLPRDEFCLLLARELKATPGRGSPTGDELVGRVNVHSARR